MPSPESRIQDLARGLDGLEPLDIKPPSLTQVAYEAVRRAIVSKALAPGTIVSESSLAARLAVSKTPVREALVRLQMVGLVEADGSRGLRIVLPSEVSIREAYEVRAVLEAGLCRQAAERADELAVEEITMAARRSLDSADREDLAGFKQWDRRFHQAIADAAGNPRLAALTDDARALAGVLRERDVPEVQDAIRCAHQHLAIAEAVADHRGTEAYAASERHVEDVKEMVLAAFVQRPGAGGAARGN